MADVTALKQMKAQLARFEDENEEIVGKSKQLAPIIFGDDIQLPQWENEENSDASDLSTRNTSSVTVSQEENTSEQSTSSSDLTGLTVLENVGVDANTLNVVLKLAVYKEFLKFDLAFASRNQIKARTV